MKKSRLCDAPEEKVQELIDKICVEQEQSNSSLVNLPVLLKQMNYRQITDIWIKPFASTLLVMDFPILDELRLTQWFSSNNSNQLCIWNSDTILISTIIGIIDLQYLESTVCKGGMLSYSKPIDIPALHWSEMLEL